jgi:hypothetical protein
VRSPHRTTVIGVYTPRDGRDRPAMASFYRIDRDSETVLYRFEGDVTDDELIRSSRSVTDAPGYRGGMKGIVDLRDVTDQVRVSAGGVRRLSEFNRSFPEELNHARMAIVASEDLAYGLSRMLQAYSEGLGGDYAIFREMTEACAWLGISAGIPDAGAEWIQLT